MSALDRFKAIQGTPSLGGWVIWDYLGQIYVKGDDGRTLRFQARAEAETEANRLNQPIQLADPDVCEHCGHVFNATTGSPSCACDPLYVH